MSGPDLTISGTNSTNTAVGLYNDNVPVDDSQLTTTERLALVIPDDTIFSDNAPDDYSRLTTTERLALENSGGMLLAGSIEPNPIRAKGVEAGLAIVGGFVNLIDNVTNARLVNSDFSDALPEIRELLNDAREKGGSSGVLVELKTQTSRQMGDGREQLFYKGMRVVGEGLSPQIVIDANKRTEIFPSKYDFEYLWIKPNENSNVGSLDGSDTNYNPIGPTKTILESELPSR